MRHRHVEAVSRVSGTTGGTFTVLLATTQSSDPRNCVRTNGSLENSKTLLARNSFEPRQPRECEAFARLRALEGSPQGQRGTREPVVLCSRFAWRLSARRLCACEGRRGELQCISAMLSLCENTCSRLRHSDGLCLPVYGMSMRSGPRTHGSERTASIISSRLAYLISRGSTVGC